MKKSLFLLLLVLSLVLPGFSQSITVTKPGTGDVWYTGTTHTIIWGGANLSGQVKIRLYNAAGTVIVSKIADKAANNGGFPWVIPGTLSDGHYRVRVRSLADTKVFDDSDLFEIKKAPPNLIQAVVPKTVQMVRIEPLHMVSPVKGETWRMGEQHTIRWNSLQMAPERLSIYIIARNAGRAGPIWIVRNTGNKGFYVWNIPVNLKRSGLQPGDYHMVLRGPTGADLTRSEFHLGNATSQSLMPSVNSKFTILDNLKWSFAGKGRLGVLTISVQADSANDFILAPGSGDNDFGTQYLTCRVECKVPTAELNQQPVQKIMVQDIFSVDGRLGSRHFVQAPVYPVILRKDATYNLSFQFKEHSGILCFIDSADDKSGFIGKIEGMPHHPDACQIFYFPKLVVELHTKDQSGGTRTVQKVFYLDYSNLEQAGYTITWFQVQREICGGWPRW